MRRVLLASLIVLAACGDDKTPPIIEPVEIPGNYSVVSVNGDVVPAPIESPLILTEGALTLNHDGTYHDTRRATANGTSGLYGGDVVGTYTVADNTITLTPTHNPTMPLSGTVANGRITITREGLAYVYQRE